MPRIRSTVRRKNAQQKPKAERKNRDAWKNNTKFVPPKPGEVRNPKGKNGSEWISAFKKFFGEDLDTDILRMKDPNAPQVIRLNNVFAAMYKSALMGDVRAQEFIMQAMGIDPAQKIELTGKDGEPLNKPAGPIVRLYMPDANTRDNSPVPPPTPEPKMPLLPAETLGAAVVVEVDDPPIEGGE